MVETTAGTGPEAAFQTEIERIRASGALGKGTQPQRLFEFLVACLAQQRTPKELEVAVHCFERSAQTDVAQDATVRVAAHKLRKRLEEFYRDSGAAMRLTLPRGEYRLVLESAPAASPADVPGLRRLLPATARERVAAGIIFVLLAGVAFAVSLLSRGPRVPAAVAELRQAALWAPLLADDLPVQLVLGDYFIFGERDERGDVRRLVRDFEINSPEELERGFLSDASRAERYVDLKLGYLPTSSAQALREVLPVVTGAGKPVMVTLASELDPSTIKTTHLIYIGYFSALGMLQDIVMADSRYSFGGSYDELIDAISGEIWTSEAGEVHFEAERYRDYGYLARLRGPAGNALLIIAGTRDTGLMQAAELAADHEALRTLASRIPGTDPFEALYEVQGVNGINVGSRLIEASPVAR